MHSSGFRQARIFRFLILGLTFALSSCSRMEAEHTRNTNRPDVLLISVDTLRSDSTGFGGESPSPSPTLDRISQSSTIFTRALTPMPRTTPALASLMTGLWPKHHGCREVGDPILRGRTLAQILQAQGYHTAAVTANPSAGPAQGLGKGFDRFVTSRGLFLGYRQQLYDDFGRDSPSGISWAEATTSQAIRLARETSTDQPLFLWIFYFDPHFLYMPPQPWQKELMTPVVKQLYSRFQTQPTRRNDIHSGQLPLARAALPACRQLYDAEISSTDFQINRLVSAMEELGRWKDALVVFTSDHGENFGEGGLFFDHGPNLEEAAIHVPLFFKGGPFPKGRLRQDIASLVDVLPTILGALNIETTNFWDGQDLLSDEITNSPTERVVFTESASSLWSTTFTAITSGRSEGRPCAHGSRFSLCLDHRKEVFRLYDHQLDPELQHDISDRFPEQVHELRAQFERWPPESARWRAACTSRFKLLQKPRAKGGYSEQLIDISRGSSEEQDRLKEFEDTASALHDKLERWASDIPQPIPRKINPETEKQLRALGYIQ